MFMAGSTARTLANYIDRSRYVCEGKANWTKPQYQRSTPQILMHKKFFFLPSTNCIDFSENLISED